MPSLHRHQPIRLFPALLTLLLPLITATACSPPSPQQTPQAPPQALMSTALLQVTHAGIDFNLVCFDQRQYQLLVADQPAGPGSRWPDAKAAAQHHNALAAINAGFFTPEGKPLGLVIENGQQRGSFNPSSLGNGIYTLTPIGAKLTRSTHWKTTLSTKPQHLLQAGPMLVDHSTVTKGLSTQNARPRSFIATDSQNHWIIGHASSCTLSQLGSALATLKLNGFTTHTAMNLDGGRSSDLYVSPTIQNGPKSIRPFWNKPVRNFLILKKK